MERLVTVRIFQNLPEAGLAVNLLKKQDIYAEVDTFTSGGWLASFYVKARAGGYHVKVRNQDLEKATELLGASFKD